MFITFYVFCLHGSCAVSMTTSNCFGGTQSCVYVLLSVCLSVCLSCNVNSNYVSNKHCNAFTKTSIESTHPVYMHSKTGVISTPLPTTCCHVVIIALCFRVIRLRYSTSPYVPKPVLIVLDRIRWVAWLGLWLILTKIPFLHRSDCLKQSVDIDIFCAVSKDITLFNCLS